MASGFGSAFREAIYRAQLVPGGAVLFLLRDCRDVGHMVFGGHWNPGDPQTSEGCVVIEE